MADSSVTPLLCRGKRDYWSERYERAGDMESGTGNTLYWGQNTQVHVCIALTSFSSTLPLLSHLQPRVCGVFPLPFHRASLGDPKHGGVVSG